LTNAILALEDGNVFEGRSFGAPTERSGEVVFNTALTGYQEVFTDPSYSGQIVILTNPPVICVAIPLQPVTPEGRMTCTLPVADTVPAMDELLPHGEGRAESS
jgi:carbamoylphosphate synthase small subunit